MSIKRAEELELLIEKIKKAFGVQNYETAILQSKQKTHDVHTKNMLFLTGIFVELGDHLVEIYKRMNANDFLENDSCVFAQILAIQAELEGMKIANEVKRSINELPSYLEEDFVRKADQLKELVSKK